MAVTLVGISMIVGVIVCGDALFFAGTRDEG